MSADAGRVGPGAPLYPQAAAVPGAVVPHMAPGGAVAHPTPPPPPPPATPAAPVAPPAAAGPVANANAAAVGPPAAPPAVAGPFPGAGAVPGEAAPVAAAAEVATPVHSHGTRGSSGVVMTPSAAAAVADSGAEVLLEAGVHLSPECLQQLDGVVGPGKGTVAWELLPSVAQYVSKAGNTGMVVLTSTFTKRYPSSGVTQRKLHKLVNTIAVKEKRYGMSRPEWFVRKEFLPLLDGVMTAAEVDVPMAGTAPKPAKKAKTTPTPAPARTEAADPTSQAAPAAEIVLPPHTKHTAAVLCHAIRMELQKGDVPTAMTPSGKRSVPWDRVARNPMLLNTTVYGVPTKCQRLWKFIAYGFDIGDSTCLAPDSDDEDLPSNGAADGAAAGAVGGAAAAGAGAGAGAGAAAGL